MSIAFKTRWQILGPITVKSYTHPCLATGARLPRDFEYLVGMPISTLTAEKVAKLMQEQEKKAGTAGTKGQWLLKGFPQCRSTDLERHDS